MFELIVNLMDIWLVVFSYLKLLVGDNSLVQILRILTSIELFVNAAFYSHRLSFLSPVDKHAEYFSNINKLLPMSVSQQSIDTGYIYIYMYIYM